LFGDYHFSGSDGRLKGVDPCHPLFFRSLDRTKKFIAMNTNMEIAIENRTIGSLPLLIP